MEDLEVIMMVNANYYRQELEQINRKLRALYLSRKRRGKRVPHLSMLRITSRSV